MEDKRKRRSRNIALAAVVCVVALVAIGVMMWHPWDTGVPAGPDSGGEEMSVTDDTGAQDAGDGSSEMTDEASQDGGQQEEAWPGQSKGYVGLNGEGVIKREDYDSDEEYTNAAVATGEKQADVPHELVEDPDGKTGYYEGALVINFYRSYGELSAREIVAEFGGIWVKDIFAWNTGLDYAMADAYFPDVKGKDGLRALADRIMERPEVESASLDTVFESSADVSSSPAEASLSDVSSESRRDIGPSSSIIGYPVNDPESSLQYMLTHSGFSLAWNTSRCEGRVQVAIFDSGIDADHEDLAVNIVARYDAFHGGPLQGTGQDASGHGTMVAGVVSAAANNAVGVAGGSYNAGLIPVRVNSQGQFVSWQAVETAFNYVFFLSEKPEVINMSFCGTSGSFEDSGQQQRLQSLINTARDVYDIVCVSSVGNDGDGQENYPSKFAGVLGVGSIDSNNTAATSSNRNQYVDLCAPGVDILSTANPEFADGNLYASGSGTSFSAPQVAAAAALVKAQHPSWEADQVEGRLISTAHDLGDVGRDDQYGAGSLDAAAAVGWRPPSPPTPTANHFGNETVDTQPAPPSSLLKTYGVRGGGAGPDFLGITNTNYSFPAGSSTSPDQYTGTTPTDLQGHEGAGLALWATSVNENVNPYYANLYYDILTGSNVTPRATTWMSNDASVSSWGDSNGSASHVGNVPGGAATIAGLEYNPQIIFGANKYTNWNLASDGFNSDTNIYDSGYDATYVTNDATNIWAQVYTMRQLAYAADGMSGTTTRYNSSVAATSAQNYENAIKGNLRYVASRIDQGAVARKTVAYLYAIDVDGTGYFFTPTAAGLTGGDDTGATDTNHATNPDDSYAANDSTISYGFRATLPFVTNTFNSGVPFAGGIVMRVEDIYKTNPACTVSSSASSALSGVDTIIYNSTMLTNLDGSQEGRNVSGVDNDYRGTPLNTTKVAVWAAAHGFAGSQVISGDDFGTSSQQGYGTRVADAEGMAPLLYCQDDYTADKNARAAWAFSIVYPELYGDNPNATYAYWVDKVYHVNTGDVPAVVAYMTNQNDTVTYHPGVANMVNHHIQAGLTWWSTTGQYDPDWNRYAYYNGSSRASYYSNDPASEEPADTIGILAP